MSEMDHLKAKSLKIALGVLAIGIGGGAIYAIGKVNADKIKAAQIKFVNWIKINRNGEKVEGTEDTYQTDTTVGDDVQSKTTMIAYLGSISPGVVITGSNGASLTIRYDGLWMYDWNNLSVQTVLKDYLATQVIPGLINSGARGFLVLDGWADQIRYESGGVVVQNIKSAVKEALAWNDATHLHHLYGIVLAAHNYN